MQTELFWKLFELNLVKNRYWWPSFGEFEVVVSAILTQNTKWQNVETSLANLRQNGVLNLESLAQIKEMDLANLIKPSGFYNQKAKKLKNLCVNIAKEFGDFEGFKLVSKEWLISQKGIGAETCSAILCYALGRDEMVVDSYTLRVLGYLNYEFESYDEAREWLEALDFGDIFARSSLSDENEIFCYFHGAIVEFCKAHLKGKVFDEFAKNLLDELK